MTEYAEQLNRMRPRKWEQVPIRNSAQKDAGLFGGEGGQYVLAIAYAPSNPDILYMATDTSGVWKSEDGGSLWKNKSKGFVSNGGASIAVDPLNPNVCFIAGTLGVSYSDGHGITTKVNGIYRTIDGGETWRMVYDTPFYKIGEGNGDCFYFDTSLRNSEKTLKCFCGTYEDGLLKTEDGGNTWESCGSITDPILDIKPLYSQNDVLLIVTSTGLYKYDDSDQSVTAIGSGLPATLNTIAASPASPSMVLAACGTSMVYKSTNGGLSFTAAGSGLYGGSLSYTKVAISPVDANICYANGRNGHSPYHSADGGANWLPTVNDDLGSLLPDAAGWYFDIPFAMHPDEANTCITASNGHARILKTIDGGSNWSYSGSGFTGHACKDIAFVSESDAVYAFLDHNVYRSSDSRNTFECLDVPNYLGYESATAIAVNGDTIVTCMGTWASGNFCISVSTDGGATWSNKTAYTGDFKFIGINANDTNCIYAGGYRSIDGGATWSAMAYPSWGMYPSNNDYVYSVVSDGGKSRIYRSTDKGATWSALTPISGLIYSHTKSFAVHPTDPDIVYAANNYFFGIFDGASWSYKDGSRGGLIPDSNNYTCSAGIAVDPNHTDRIYVARASYSSGQSNGVWMSDDGGDTWENISFNIGPDITCMSIHINPFDSSVYVGTYRGTYRLPYLTVTKNINYPYTQVVLCTIATSSPLRFANADFYDSENNFYKAGLTAAPDIIEALPDIYNGVDDSQSVTLEFVNERRTIDDNWYTIADSEELLGKWVTIGVYDLDGTEAIYVGKIQSYLLGETVTIEVDTRQDIGLETYLPRRVVTTDDYHETALDVNKPICICFGNCRDVPCRNIRNDTSSGIYDYAICEGGPDGIEGIWSSSGLGVKRDGDRLVSGADYTFYDGSQASPYPGIAFLRFSAEQIGFSNEQIKITADVRGMKLNNDLGIRERSFALNTKNLLSNSTWGLGQAVDTASFAAADVSLSSDFWRCEGCIGADRQRQARDIINAMLAPARGAYIYRGTDGEWEMAVPGTGSSAAIFGEADGYYNNCEIVSMGSVSVDNCPSTVTINYSESNLVKHPTKTLSYDTGKSFGVERVYDFEFVESTTTAKKVCSYRVKRAIYDKTIEIRAGTEARRLKRGNIITIISPTKTPLQTGKDYIIESIQRIINSEGYSITGIEYNDDLYADVTISDPTEQTLPAGTVSGPQSFVGSLSLGDGDTQPGTITLNAPISQKVFVNAGKTGFGNSETGFIIGLDDDGLAKLYLGNSSYYINWTGSAPVVKAAHVELTSSGDLIATNVDLSGIIKASSGELGDLTVTGDLTITSGAIIAGAVTLDSDGLIIKNGENYVSITSAGLVGYDSVLGKTVDIPVNGDAPEFSSGIIKECIYQLYTSGVIRTNADPASNGGLLINNASMTGYNSSGTKLFQTVYDGTDEGDFYFGDYDNDNHGLAYDHSAGEANYRGSLIDRTPWILKSDSFTAEPNKKYKIDTTSKIWSDESLYVPEISATGASWPMASKALSAAIDCTGLTKSNGFLSIDLKCDDWSLVDYGRIEITSSGGRDINEWSVLTPTLSDNDVWLSVDIPIADAATQGGELNVSAIDFINLVASVTGSVTISWKNAKISFGGLFMNLPSTLTEKDSVRWLDLALNFSTNPFRIVHNGHKMCGFENTDMVCQNNDESGALEYTGSTYGMKLI